MLYIEKICEYHVYDIEVENTQKSIVLQINEKVGICLILGSNRSIIKASIKKMYSKKVIHNYKDNNR